MSPADAAKLLAGLNWSGVPATHQLAASAALETLRAATVGFEPMTITEHYNGRTIVVPDLCEDEGCPHAGTPHVCITAPAPSNVVQIPVRPRTCWTTICHLDGRQWAASSHFGPAGAWGWVLDCVMEEHGVSEDQIGGAESDSEGVYEGDDLVTIDGLPVYRIQHFTA